MTRVKRSYRPKAEAAEQEFEYDKERVEALFADLAKIRRGHRIKDVKKWLGIGCGLLLALYLLIAALGRAARVC